MRGANGRLTPFGWIAILAAIGLVAFMVFPPYLTFKDLAQQRALEAAASEAQARLNGAFASLVLSGVPCPQALGMLDARTIYEDPHSDGHLKSLWEIRKIDCAGDSGACVLYLRGAYEDVQDMEVTVNLTLPACPEPSPSSPAAEEAVPEESTETQPASAPQ